MSSPLSADRMVSAILSGGAKVAEYGDWRTHNRNHMGDWGPVHGVMIHHTVTSGTESSVRLCYDGRSGLPGPLCHGVIAKDGTVHMVGHGRANHAGLGDGDVLTAVRTGTARPADSEADTDGNTHFYGFECVNLGDGADPWPPEQVEAIARVSAAICRAHGWTENAVIGHSEWQPGKVDPRGPGISMDDVRRRVAGLLVRDDEMPHFLSLGMTIPFTINDPGVWVSVPWDTEWSDGAEQHYDGAQSFAADGAQYNGVIQLKLTGLTPGAEVQVRIVEGDDRRLPVAEGVGTLGNSYPSIPVCGKVSEGRRAKLMITHFGHGPVTIERAELKAQVWT